MGKIWNKIVSIGERLFEVNTSRQKLISFEIRGCECPFEMLDYSERDYAAGYLDVKYNVFLRDAVDDPNIIQFKILKGILYDLRLNQVNVDRVNEIAHQYGYNTQILGQEVSERIFGMRPIIDIGGNPYIIDLTNSRLVHRNQPGNVIDLSDCRMIKKSGEYEFYYNLRINRKVDIDPSEHQPGEIVKVRIPSVEKLDPVGWALENGVSIVTQLKSHPPIKGLAAEIEPVHKKQVARKETSVTRQIKKNNKSIK